MKKYISILMVILAPFSIVAQGIEFFEGSWQEVLAESRRSGKLIFMDAYTTWCGPCKMMASKVFPEAEVGTFYNANFVNVKIDMEKGEGVELAGMYGVRAYPTLLFIDSDGEMVHTSVGYHTPAALISLGKDALNPDKQFATSKRKYEEGNRNPEFLKNYALMLSHSYDPHANEVAAEYMKLQKDWGTKENIHFMVNFLGDTKNKISLYMLENPKSFENVLGEERVAELKERIIIEELQKHGRSMSEAEFDDMADKVLGEKNKVLKEDFKMYYFQLNGQNDKVIEYMKDKGYLKAKGNPAALNANAWFVYEKSDNKKDLKEALKWAEEAISIGKNYAVMDTKAALLLKMGNYKKGMAAAEEAIAYAKANGEDYSDTLELIGKFKK